MKFSKKLQGVRVQVVPYLVHSNSFLLEALAARRAGATGKLTGAVETGHGTCVEVVHDDAEAYLHPHCGWYDLDELILGFPDDLTNR